jgi:hydrogenase maturation factor
VTLDCHSDHCITCGDEGIPMTVLRIDDAKSSVEIALVEAEPGDELLVHAGVALVRLSESPADCGLSTAGLSEAKPR